MRVDYGDFVAVEGLSLTVPRGEVYGLVGPNGAGKTSSFKVLATLMAPTYGDVFINGVDIALRPEQARSHLGYMPDLAPVASDLKVFEFLDLFAGAHGIAPADRPARIRHCLGQVKLFEKRAAMCKNLSRGMMQRLVLAKTLLHQPSLYLLDEPASGMDPASRADLRETVRELARGGAAVLLSSHILSELEDMCTMIGLMAGGKLVDSGRVDELVDRRTASPSRTLTATAVKAVDALVQFLTGHDKTTPAEPVDRSVSFSFTGDDDDQADLLAEMLGAGLRIKSLTERRASIERVLLDLEPGDDQGLR
jgi:ABC-2 type transport system ATP-binding protein